MTLYLFSRFYWNYTGAEAIEKINRNKIIMASYNRYSH